MKIGFVCVLLRQKFMLYILRMENMVGRNLGQFRILQESMLS